jgi:hypothetical protein
MKSPRSREGRKGSPKIYLKSLRSLGALGALAVSFILLALIVAWAASGFSRVQSWTSFLVVVLLGAGILWGGWKLTSLDAGLDLPAWLAWLVIGAALLRLAAGLLWSLALPVFGYGNLAESQGYVMADAHQRDQAAWELARSDDPLVRAFTGYRKEDQYGGFLYLSAFVYRYFGGATHQPVQMVVLTAAFSALAVLFTWALVRRSWGPAAAMLSAWIVTLYPEVVLLGSSQMREAFIMALAAAGFYGLLLYWQARTWHGLAWVLGALVLSLPFSPPFAALLMGTLVVQVLFMGGWQVVHRRRLWSLFGLVALLAGLGVWLAWDQLAPQEVNNPLALAGWWLRQTAQWQAYVSESASGWIQRTFDRYLPIWAQMPFLVLYGVVRPFLPAALIDTSVPIWKAIAIWRSAGWALLLAFLVYATWLTWTRPRGRGVARGLSVVIWMVILLASFRGGGDVWDNPRYRVAFAGLQAALVSWAWVEYRQSRDPWLRRVLIAASIMLAWFIPWYLRRYTPLEWPVVDLFKTVGLGLATAILAIFWDWVRVNSP